MSFYASFFTLPPQISKWTETAKKESYVKGETSKKVEAVLGQDRTGDLRISQPTGWIILREIWDRRSNQLSHEDVGTLIVVGWLKLPVSEPISVTSKGVWGSHDLWMVSYDAFSI